MGQRAIPSWISRHSYLSAAQTVKNKKLDHRVRENENAVLATWRHDGRLPMSPVTVGLDGAGRAIISSQETTYKVRNLRRDPRAALCVFVEAFLGPWVQIEGTASPSWGSGAYDGGLPSRAAMPSGPPLHIAAWRERHLDGHSTAASAPACPPRRHGQSTPARWLGQRAASPPSSRYTRPRSAAGPPGGTHCCTRPSPTGPSSQPGGACRAGASHGARSRRGTESRVQT